MVLSKHRFMSDACSAFWLRNDSLTCISGGKKRKRRRSRRKKRRKYFSPFSLFLLVYEEKARGSRDFNEDCASRRTMLADAVIPEWTFASGPSVHGNTYLACDLHHVHYHLRVYILIFSYRCILSALDISTYQDYVILRFYLAFLTRNGT